MTDNTISLYDYRTLLGVIEHTAQTKRFLRDRFFPTVQTFLTEQVDVDIVDHRNERGLAEFSDPESDGHVSYADGFVTEQFTPANIDERRVISGRNALKRAPGETPYSHSDPHARIVAEVQRAYTVLDERISRSEEWMAARALLDGKIDFRGPGVNATINYWKYLATNEKPELTAGTAWNASGAKPIDTLRAAFDRIGELSGNTPIGVLLGAKAWQALFAYFCEDGKNILDNRRIDVGSIAPRMDNQAGVAYKMTLREPSIDVYTYTGSYRNTSGILTPYIPDDMGLMFCENAQTTRAYGACIVYDQNNNEQIVAAPRVVNSWFQRDKKPQGRIVQVQSKPLLIVHDPQSFCTLKGLVTA